MGKKRNVHHRKPTSLGGKNDPRNLVSVPQNQHEAWHVLFRNYPAFVIADIINRTWIDPDYYLVCRKRRGALTDDEKKERRK